MNREVFTFFYDSPIWYLADKLLITFWSAQSELRNSHTILLFTYTVHCSRIINYILWMFKLNFKVFILFTHHLCCTLRKKYYRHLWILKMNLEVLIIFYNSHIKYVVEKLFPTCVNFENCSSNFPYYFTIRLYYT